MYFKTLVLAATLTLFTTGAALASDMSKTDAAAAQKMASIILHLNHRPDAAGKDALRNIANDSNASPQTRAVASALINMDHSVSDSDKGKLRDIANDDTAPQNTRAIASILVNLTHKASRSDKSQLEAIAR